MSAGNYVGIGGTIVIFGLTILVVMKEFLVPWLIRRVRFRRPTPRVQTPHGKVRGTRITFGHGRRR